MPQGKIFDADFSRLGKHKELPEINNGFFPKGALPPTRRKKLNIYKFICTASMFGLCNIVSVKALHRNETR